jgi:hypothetical protein
VEIQQPPCQPLIRRFLAIPSGRMTGNSQVTVVTAL